MFAKVHNQKWYKKISTKWANLWLLHLDIENVLVKKRLITFQRDLSSRFTPRIYFMTAQMNLMQNTKKKRNKLKLSCHQNSIISLQDLTKHVDQILRYIGHKSNLREASLLLKISLKVWSKYRYSLQETRVNQANSASSHKIMDLRAFNLSHFPSKTARLY